MFLSAENAGELLDDAIAELSQKLPKTEDDYKELAYYQVMRSAKSVYFEGKVQSQVSLISNLAQYFKRAAWSMEQRRLEGH